MIQTGSKKGLFVGICILVSILLTGYNGFKLMTLFDPFLLKRSDSVIKAMEKWRQFKTKSEEVLSQALNDSEIKMLTSKIGYPLKKREVSIIKTSKDDNKIEKTIEEKLPVLSGILQVLNVQGKTNSYALMEGKKLKEGFKISDFTVQKITENGVLLARGGKTWFIDSPKVYFSLDQGK